MLENLQSLARRVILGSTAALMAAHTATAVADEPPTQGQEREAEGVLAERGKVTKSVRTAKPRLILKHASDALYKLYSSHRSHRSHSSHRSHYSSYQPAPAASAPSAPQPQPRAAAPAAPLTLGARALRRGMTGSDVAELMLLLFKRGLLTPEQLNTNSQYTAAVENAVRAYQRTRGLSPTGIADAGTIIALKQVLERP